MAYTVTRRTREIGVRTALGASPENVVRMVFGQSMVIAGAGAVIGIIVAIALGQILVSLLYGVTARDPLAILTSAAELLITAAVASYLPARRAAAIDPLKALRDERCVRARRSGVRACGMVAPQIEPRFPRHKPPRRRRHAYLRRFVLARVIAPDGFDCSSELAG
jgi:predicted lysophospholipase L1 biosynthesis ABC-type transport system permease subunit